MGRGQQLVMEVVYFHRKPRPDYNFSVENLFQQIREALPKSLTWRVVEMKYFSQGFFPRLFISIQAAFNQGDVNHITGDVNFIAIFLRKRHTVLTFLDIGLMNHPNWLARTLLRWFWIVLPVRRSAVITTISEATKLELLKYVRADPSKIKVVYVPISPRFIYVPKVFNKERPRILQMGTLHNKNVNRLVQALHGIPCTLDIVGEIKPDLQNELDNAGIHYIASKNISNEEVVLKYQSADIISFVSSYEGFGMPIVEANAVGRVVVTSNLLSMPEVAGNAAHLVDPFNVDSIRYGILKVIEDDAYREKLIANGFVNRKRFDVHEIARQYTMIYESL